VSLNLRIATPRTAALGVDGHICELQLILLSFAELKVPLAPLCHRAELWRMGAGAECWRGKRGVRARLRSRRVTGARWAQRRSDTMPDWL
jgi:hypothetical protein